MFGEKSKHFSSLTCIARPLLYNFKTCLPQGIFNLGSQVHGQKQLCFFFPIVFICSLATLADYSWVSLLGLTTLVV
jgi:hypothetical protein